MSLPEWAHPDIYERLWTVGELSEALHNLGWISSSVDPTTEYLIDIETVSEVTIYKEDGSEVNEFKRELVTETRVGQPLTRWIVWLDPKEELAPLRLPRDNHRQATPLQAACVIVAIARG